MPTTAREWMNFPSCSVLYTLYSVQYIIIPLLSWVLQSESHCHSHCSWKAYTKHDVNYFNALQLLTYWISLTMMSGSKPAVAVFTLATFLLKVENLNLMSDLSSYCVNQKFCHKAIQLMYDCTCTCTLLLLLFLLFVFAAVAYMYRLEVPYALLGFTVFVATASTSNPSKYYQWPKLLNFSIFTGTGVSNLV